MEELREHFEPIIAQQEDDYNEKFCLDTQVQVRNVTKEVPLQTSPILNAIKAQNKTLTNAILASNKAILESNQSLVEAIQSSRKAPSAFEAVNWTPIVQGLATGFAQAFGAQISFPTTPAPEAPLVTPATPEQTPGEVQVLRQEVKQLTNTVNTLAKTVANISQQPAIPDAIVQLMNKQDQRIDRLESMLTAFMQAQIRKDPNNGSNDSGSTPASSTPPASSPSESTPTAPAVPSANSSSSSTPNSPNSLVPKLTPATEAMVQEHGKRGYQLYI